ncbi:hypothetical protein ASD40_12710 [Paenibacillus sp. Root444D2]|nr:hypothetical protein ASD40_12710 [Paenibacillus sp. Root444D2]
MKFIVSARFSEVPDVFSCFKHVFHRYGVTYSRFPHFNVKFIVSADIRLILVEISYFKHVFHRYGVTFSRFPHFNDEIHRFSTLLGRSGRILLL